MTFVVSATNKRLFGELYPRFAKGHGVQAFKQEQLIGPAQTFLTAETMRATHGILKPEEIAGIVAAGIMDVVTPLPLSTSILEIGGMGGDKGFMIDGRRQKVINASTLASIVVASLGIPTLKHGGYANTSVMGATDTIEALGVNIFQTSPDHIQSYFRNTGFFFSATQIAKTMHDLTHNPFARYETITHLIGPMTLPLTRQTQVNKVFGLNESVHPETVGKAYEILHQKNYQNVGNIITVSGLDESSLRRANPLDSLQEHVILDEVSPFQTAIGIVQQGKYKGCTFITPEDFGIALPPQSIYVPNNHQDVLSANQQALSGENQNLSIYLAMNAALALFTAVYLERDDAIINGKLNRKYLQECFYDCLVTICYGKAQKQLELIRKVSQITGS